MLDATVTRAVIGAWRAVWDPFVEPQVGVWQKALGRAGMTAENAVGLNSAFLVWWTGDKAPKLGHLLSWLRNRVPSEGHEAPPIKGHLMNRPGVRKVAGECIGRMRRRLKGEGE